MKRIVVIFCSLIVPFLGMADSAECTFNAVQAKVLVDKVMTKYEQGVFLEHFRKYIENNENAVQRALSDLMQNINLSEDERYNAHMILDRYQELIAMVFVYHTQNAAIQEARKMLFVERLNVSQSLSAPSLTRADYARLEQEVDAMLARDPQFSDYFMALNKIQELYDCYMSHVMTAYQEWSDDMNDEGYAAFKGQEAEMVKIAFTALARALESI